MPEFALFYKSIILQFALIKLSSTRLGALPHLDTAASDDQSTA